MADQEKQSGNDLAAGQNAGASEPSSNIVTDVDALKKQVQALHESNDDQAAQIAGLSARLSSLESRAGSLETSVGSLSSTTTSHASKLDELDKREGRSPLEDENLKSLLCKYGLK